MALQISLKKGLNLGESLLPEVGGDFCKFLQSKNLTFCHVVEDQLRKQFFELPLKEINLATSPAAHLKKKICNANSHFNLSCRRRSALDLQISLIRINLVALLVKILSKKYWFLNTT